MPCSRCSPTTCVCCYRRTFSGRYYLPENVRVVQFADDTQLLVSGKKCDLRQIIDRIERAVEGLFTWFCANRMKLNGSKTQVLVLGTPALIRGMPPVAINVMGTVIPDSCLLGF